MIKGQSKHRCASCPPYGIGVCSVLAATQKERERAIRLVKVYGITVSDYEAMHRGQGGVCAICGQSEDRRLAVDHDHATGAVRGLLCGDCNQGLGRFGDDSKKLRAAADYLENHLTKGGKPTVGN